MFEVEVEFNCRWRFVGRYEQLQRAREASCFLWDTSRPAGKEYVFFLSMDTFVFRKSNLLIRDEIRPFTSLSISKISRWWFQILFILTPKIGEDDLILTNLDNPVETTTYCRILQPPYLSDRLAFSLFHMPQGKHATTTAVKKKCCCEC